MATRQLPPRREVRTLLLLAGLLPALLALAFAVKIGLMLSTDSAGRDAYDRGDRDGAAAQFHDNRTLNWFEPWVAAFDEGTAHHADGDPSRAIPLYEKALEDVPSREECTVRINLALAHEAVGDTALEDGDAEGATAEWEAGLEALRAADCPIRAGRDQAQSDDAAAVEKRLEDKLEEQEQEQEQQDPPPEPQEPPPDPPEPQDPGTDPRQERLDRNNEQGRNQRREDQELYQDGNYGYPESW